MLKLTLGTAQFGMDYGITNRTGTVLDTELSRILSLAKNAGISMLDTASSYGNSESRLGDSTDDSFNIITKLNRNKDKDNFKKVDESLLNLKRESIYGVMYHDENHFLSDSIGRNALAQLKKEGKCDKVGCSFYSIEALEIALNTIDEIDIIQIPGSCLDQRFLDSGLLHFAKTRGVEVYCRSLFLQGLLLEPIELPSSIQSGQKDIERFFCFSKTHGLSPMELAISFIVFNKHIDYGVVGCVSRKQLKEIIESYNKVHLQGDNLDLSSLKSSNHKLLNPSLW